MLATQPSSNWQSVLQSWSESSPSEIHPSIAALRPDAALIAGIAAYRRHPGHRTLTDPPTLWAQGATRLLDYGPPDAPPVLFVPSLVNRAYILDLAQDNAMLRYLAQNGIRPLLLDWGFPDDSELGFSLTDYITQRLEPAMHAIGDKLALCGYCMGGLLALAATQRNPTHITKLALLATPWDFWADHATEAQNAKTFLALLEPALTLGGTMPVDALQLLFSLLDPGSVAAKYRDFGRQDQTTPRAHQFVAIEDWLNDGVPLTAPVAREVLGGWYGENTTARNQWRIAGTPITPQTLPHPAFVAIPDRDRIVPPASAQRLAHLLPHATTHHIHGGHVGMIAGTQAPTTLWHPLLSWLK